MHIILSIQVMSLANIEPSVTIIPIKIYNVSTPSDKFAYEPLQLNLS